MSQEGESLCESLFTQNPVGVPCRASGCRYSEVLEAPVMSGEGLLHQVVSHAFHRHGGPHRTRQDRHRRELRQEIWRHVQRLSGKQNITSQVRGLDAWASRVKCPAQLRHIDMKYIFDTNRYIKMTKSNHN